MTKRIFRLIVYIHHKAEEIFMQPQKSTCYCIHLRRAANAVTACYDRILAPSGLTVNQFSLLRHLERLGPSSITALAASVGLERTTLTRTLRPLQAHGFVQDTSAASRRRALVLTEEGRRVLDAAMPLWQEAQAEVERRLGKECAQWLYVLNERL